ALSVMIALWIREPLVGRTRLWLMRLVALNAVIVAVVLLIVTLGAFWSHDPAWFFEPIAKMLRAKDRANLFVIREGLADFGPVFTAVALLSGVLWLALAGFLWGGKLKLAARSLVLISILLAFVSRAIVLPAMAAAKSYKPFMEQVNRQVQARKL